MDKNLYALLMALDEEAFARVHLNNVAMQLPAGTLVTLCGCLHIVEGRPILYVETGHSQWMLDHLDAETVFIDVGAATGAMTVPFALRYPSLEAYAFEPAIRARRLLTKTLERNGITNVRVFDQAVSETSGVTTFLERHVDPSGSVPFLPETSSLTLTPSVSTDDVTAFDVAVTTLDAFAAEQGIRGRKVVVKIDIEGYEAFALRGATEFIKSNVVYFAVDIHASPEHDGMTGDDCRRELGNVGYTFSEDLHVLLCTPPSSASLS